MKFQYLIEFGTGVDLHGEDSTKAAQKAVKDAISHCCMAELPALVAQSIQGATLTYELQIAVPHPETVDKSAVLSVLPAPTPTTLVTVSIHDGGLCVEGVPVPGAGSKTQILLANAAITVWLVQASCLNK